MFLIGNVLSIALVCQKYIGDGGKFGAFLMGGCLRSSPEARKAILAAEKACRSALSQSVRSLTTYST